MQNVGFFLSKKCGTLHSYAQVLCNLHRKSEGWSVQFRTLFLTSAILNHSHMEDKDGTFNSCFSLGRCSESWINHRIKALGLDELHEVHTVPPFKPVKVSLDASFPSVVNTTQLGAELKLAEGELSPTVHVDDKYIKKHLSQYWSLRNATCHWSPLGHQAATLWVWTSNPFPSSL